jgi:tellurite resistance protein
MTQPAATQTVRPSAAPRQPGFAMAALALAAVLAGCATPTVGTRQPEQVRAQANPVDRTQRAITNFTPALRCMDEMMFRVGTRDLTLMMEELRDSTQRVHVSARLGCRCLVTTRRT